MKDGPCNKKNLCKLSKRQNQLETRLLFNFLWEKYLVVQYVHDPGGEEGCPANDDHVADLGLSPLSGDPMEVNQSHSISHTGQGPHCQSEKGRNEAN